MTRFIKSKKRIGISTNESGDITLFQANDNSKNPSDNAIFLAPNKATLKNEYSLMEKAQFYANAMQAAMESFEGNKSYTIILDTTDVETDKNQYLKIDVIFNKDESKRKADTNEINVTDEQKLQLHELISS